MDFKYKIAEVAKDFGVPAKKVIETVAPLTGEAYKTGGTFGEKELDLLLETLTRANAETSLDAYLASRTPKEARQAGAAKTGRPKGRAAPRAPQARKAGRKTHRKARHPAGAGGQHRHQGACQSDRADQGRPRAGVGGYPHRRRQRR